MGDVVGAEVLHIAQVLERDVAGVVLVEILADAADALRRQFVAAVEADDHILIEREQVEVLVQVLDDVHGQIQALALVIEILQFVLQQQLQHELAQQLVALVVDVLGIRAVAGFGEVREIVGQILRSHVDLRDDVVFRDRFHPVHFVSGIGEDVSGAQAVGIVTVFQLDLAFQHVDELDIRVVMEGILRQGRDVDVDGVVVGIIQSFQEHAAHLPDKSYPRIFWK